jgi:trehalose synthase
MRTTVRFGGELCDIAHERLACDRRMPVLTIPVEPGPRRLSALAEPAGEPAVAAVQDLARDLRRLRIVHLATPPFAPRALDLLRSTVPLLCDCGLDVRWLAVAGDERADAAARAVGDALRGGEPGPDEDERAWRDRGALVASEIPRGTDVVVVHGAEGLALLGGAPDAPAPAPRWVWWVEGDLLRGRVPGDLVEHADAVVVEQEGFAPAGVAARVIAPAVDPLAPRNVAMDPRTAGALARATGMELTEPFLVHTTDVDGWSAAEDAIATLHAAQDAGAAGLRLAIAAHLPAGDARAWRTLGELSDHVAGTDGVLVVPDVGGAADAEVNALQRLARVAVGPRADTGIAEARWKGTPAALGSGAGARIAELVADPGLAIEAGRAEREEVREHGLVTRLLADQLRLYAELAG